MIYFDTNATTPLCDAARNAWLDASAHRWGNPSAGYGLAAKAKAGLNHSREQLGRLLQVDAESIVFCSGATEACSIWIRSFFEKKEVGQKLLVSKLDHSCVVETCEILGKDAVCWFEPSSATSVSDQLEHAYSQIPSIAGVVMMAANNVTGELFDWKGAAAWCRKKGIPFFCDTTQWIGKLPTDDFKELDYFCGSAHKFGGPKGVGFLKLSRKFKSVSGQTGGGQEGGIRAGTEATANVAAMVEALEFWNPSFSNKDEIELRRSWKKRFKQKLADSTPGVVFHERSDQMLWNTVCLSLPGKPSEWWIERLDRLGFAVAAGAACSTVHTGVPRVMQAMGVDASVASRNLRFSAGWGTTKKDWDDLLGAILHLVVEMQAPSSPDSEVISIEDL